MGLPERHNLYQTSAEQQAPDNTLSALGNIAQSVGETAGGISKKLANADKIIGDEQRAIASVASMQDYENITNSIKYKLDPDNPKLLTDLESSINKRYADAAKIAPESSFDDIEKARIKEVESAQKKAIKWKGDVKKLRESDAASNLVKIADNWAYLRGAEANKADFSQFNQSVMQPVLDNIDSKVEKGVYTPDQARQIKQQIAKNQVYRFATGLAEKHPEVADAYLNGKDSKEIDDVIKELTPYYAENVKTAKSRVSQSQIDSLNSKLATLTPNSKVYRETESEIAKLQEEQNKFNEMPSGTYEAVAQSQIKEELKSAFNTGIQRSLGKMSIAERAKANEEFRKQSADGIFNPDMFMVGIGMKEKDMSFINEGVPTEDGQMTFVSDAAKKDYENLQLLKKSVQQYANSRGMVSYLDKTTDVGSSIAATALSNLASIKPDEITGDTSKLDLAAYDTINTLRNTEMSEDDYEKAVGVVHSILNDKEVHKKIEELSKDKTLYFAPANVSNWASKLDEVGDIKGASKIREQTRNTGTQRLEEYMNNANWQALMAGAAVIQQGGSVQDAIATKKQILNQAYSDYVAKKGINLAALDEKLANKQPAITRLADGRMYEYVGRDDKDFPIFRNPNYQTAVNLVQARNSALISMDRQKKDGSRK